MPPETTSETTYGLSPVHASASTLLATNAPTTPPPFIPVTQTPIPSTALAERINEYARSHLPEPTYNHSLRVYHYGLAIKQYRFPAWNFTDETYLLACLLHDIGTTEENLHATKMSFEFYGAFLALDVLQKADTGPDAPKEQAESVAEAIIRHQDLCEKGRITALGQLLQLATIFDNTGLYADLVHPSTIDDVSLHFPRLKWSHCFASTIHRELEIKPWAHTTALGIEDFPSKVLSNTLMSPYE
ncbi:cyanamide hydratase [Aspergillus heteromorphus CBS 117.55]|uniref:Cyanamide hydratase n=1 Tax=Aspergillus heteromorphus CBS 117.55 TaxID=1448321 RepID=A0A317V5W4_9EURO|nr:cyanamide hydratase [Aspergillus heteromorphus CBS 117.55]PWY69704.1 cyanamide hydratase [Aspergillus heteromorphus CBS 117.55]